MSKELIRLRNIRMAFDDEVVLNDLNLYQRQRIPHTAWTQRLW